MSTTLASTPEAKSDNSRQGTSVGQILDEMPFHSYPLLPFELRHQVIQAALDACLSTQPYMHRRRLGHLATVNREWQHETEALTFRYLEIRSTELTFLEQTSTARRSILIKTLGIVIDLERDFDYSDILPNQAGTNGPVEHPAETEAIANVFHQAFRVLKAWDHGELNGNH